jgi:beta-lactamase class A
MTFNKILKIIILAMLLSFFGVATHFIIELFEHSETFKPIRQSDLFPLVAPERGRGLTDPLVGLGLVLNGDPFYHGLQEQLADIISENVKQGRLITASVYFSERLGPSGFAINPTEKYSPASLIKVPLMITYFKLSEMKPGLLAEKLTYDGTEDRNALEHFHSSKQLTPGKVYTVDELIARMIKYSDNNAAIMLLDRMSDDERKIFTHIFAEFGIRDAKADADYLTVGQYSLFFHVLYNATYLSRENSEKALSLLTQTEFNQGIKAGVPEDAIVADKFGEINLGSNNLLTGEQNVVGELHNCGIVWYPRHTYLLCIMTKGRDLDLLSSVIAEMSNSTWAFLKEKFPVETQL